jgi:hypothetical protein
MTADIEKIAKALAEANELCWDNCYQEGWREDARVAMREVLSCLEKPISTSGARSTMFLNEIAQYRKEQGL